MVCPTVGLGNITLLVSWILPGFGVTRSFCVVLYLDISNLHYNCGSGGILVDILSTSAHKYPFEQTTRSILFNTIVENRRHLNSRRSFIIAAGELERV